MKLAAVLLALLYAFACAELATALPRSDDSNLKTADAAAAEATEATEAGARTFGGPRKRLLLLLPIMYKLGVITTLLGVLVALAVKSVAIGLLLLGLGAANLAAVSKLKTQHSQPAAGWSGSGYPGGVPIHLHVHGGGHGSSPGGGYHQAYSGWESAPSPPHPHYTEHYEAPPHYKRR